MFGDKADWRADDRDHFDAILPAAMHKKQTSPVAGAVFLPMPEFSCAGKLAHRYWTGLNNQI